VCRNLASARFYLFSKLDILFITRNGLNFIMTKPYSAGMQSKTLDRKKLFADPILITAIFGIFLFLVLFIVYPLSILLVDSVYEENQITLSVFARIFGMSGFRNAISNTLQLGFISGILATLVGFLFAYVDMYVSVGNKFVKGLFKIVSVLPVGWPGRWPGAVRCHSSTQSYRDDEQEGYLL